MADPRPAGLFASLRSLLDSGLEVAQVRLALLGTELEEQKLRVAQALLLFGIGLLLLTVATILLCGFVVMLFWDGYRLTALGVMAAAFAAGGVAVLLAGRRQLASAPQGMFAASLGELARDRSGLSAPDSPS